MSVHMALFADSVIDVPDGDGTEVKVWKESERALRVADMGEASYGRATLERLEAFGAIEQHKAHKKVGMLRDRETPIKIF